MIVPAGLVPLVESIADLLDRLKIQHAFGGALANNYWGVVRATQDLDVLILLPALRYQELATALGEKGFSMRAGDGKPMDVEVPRMVAMARERNLFAVERAGVKVEFFVPFLPLQHEILRRAVRMPFDDRAIPVTSAEDLILLKMIFHRDKDLRDIRGILGVQKDRLDLPYLRAWAGKVLEDARTKEMEEWVRQYVKDGS